MIRKFIAAFALIFFMASTTAFAADETKVVTFDGVTVEYPKDFSDSTTMKDGVLFAYGACFGPSNWDKQDSFYKTFARQAARITALRNLAEEIGGVYVKSESKVVELNLVNSLVESTLFQNSEAFKLLEKNARVIDVNFLEGGFCMLFMAVRLEPRK